MGEWEKKKEREGMCVYSVRMSMCVCVCSRTCVCIRKWRRRVRMYRSCTAREERERKASRYESSFSYVRRRREL